MWLYRRRGQMTPESKGMKEAAMPKVGGRLRRRRGGGGDAGQPANSLRTAPYPHQIIFFFFSPIKSHWTKLDISKTEPNQYNSLFQPKPNWTVNINWSQLDTTSTYPLVDCFYSFTSSTGVRDAGCCSSLRSLITFFKNLRDLATTPWRPSPPTWPTIA